MDSLISMMEAGAYLPKHISPWLTWMQIVLFAMPILFIKHKPARILIIAQLLNTLVAYLVFVLEGDQVTKLFGLGHFFWILPLWYLARDVKSEKSKVYRYYAGVATITIIISLTVIANSKSRKHFMIHFIYINLLRKWFCNLNKWFFN